MVVAEVRCPHVERDASVRPHMTLMTGGDLAPRDAGSVMARVAELNLLDGDEVGPGEMYHLPTVDLPSVGKSCSLVVVRLETPLSLSGPLEFVPDGRRPGASLAAP